MTDSSLSNADLPNPDSPGSEQPAVPRAAATLVLLRADQQAGGLETLLVQRHAKAGFAPGAYVFPGGVVEPQDHLAGIATARTAQHAPPLDQVAERSHAFAYVHCAIRETFEETLLLLAEPNSVPPASLPPIGNLPTLDVAAPDLAPVHLSVPDVPVSDVPVPDVPAPDLAAPALAGTALPLDRLQHAREEVCAGTLAFTRWLYGHHLQPALGRLCYLSHWVTPAFSPRRYDTHFFVAAAPPGSVETDGKEVKQAKWINLHSALSAWEAGQLKMMRPTVSTLRRLNAFNAPHRTAPHRNALHSTPTYRASSPDSAPHKSAGHDNAAHDRVSDPDLLNHNMLENVLEKALRQLAQNQPCFKGNAPREPEPVHFPDAQAAPP